MERKTPDFINDLEKNYPQTLPYDKSLETLYTGSEEMEACGDKNNKIKSYGNILSFPVIEPIMPKEDSLLTPKDIQAFEQERKIQRENRAISRLICADRIYEKGQFDIEYYEKPNSSGKSIRSFAVQKFHPQRKTTLTPMEEIYKLKENGGHHFYIRPAAKFFSRDGSESQESHTLSVKITGKIAEKINNCEGEMLSEDVLHMLAMDSPVLGVIRPAAIIADGGDGIYLIYSFSDNIVNRKKDIQNLYMVLTDMLEISTEKAEAYNQVFPCPNIELYPITRQKVKVYWNNRYNIKTSNVCITMWAEALRVCPVVKGSYAEKKNDREIIDDFDAYCEKLIGVKLQSENAEYVEASPIQKSHAAKLAVQEKAKNQKKEISMRAFAKDKDGKEADIEKLHPFIFMALVNNAHKFDHKAIHTVNDVDYSKTPGKFLRDLRTIFEERNGNIKQQKSFLYHMALTLIWCNANNGEVWTIVKEYNKKLKKPLPWPIVKEIVDERLKNRGKERLSAEKLARELHLSDAFILNRAKICYSRERILMRKRKVSEKANAYRRKQTAARRQKRIDAVKQVYLAGGSYKEMEAASGWSRNTVKKYLRLVIAAQKLKYQKWVERQDLRKTEGKTIVRTPEHYVRLQNCLNGMEKDVWIAKLVNSVN